jgi:hypothetical protein
MDTFDIEARDLRGQTALHLAAQSGDMGLAQVLLEYGADPNAQEETTGWTPLHFAVAKAHYPLILQLLHHDATNVNQVDKFDWPPLLEACSRLDSRSTALLANGGANLRFRNQHQFDVLKSVDTSKKDLAAKRWMSCLLVSNGFRFEESTVQLNPDDRETLERERLFYDSRLVPAATPPFFVPDHLAPRCHSCKVLFAVTVRRYHCRSCGLVLCGDCFKWRGTQILSLDERLKYRRLGSQGGNADDAGQRPLNESRLHAAVEMSIRERGGLKNPQGPPCPATTTAPVLQPGRAPAVFRPETALADSGQAPPWEHSSLPDRPHSAPVGGVPVATKTADSSTTPGSPGRSDDSFEDPPLAEELPALGPPASVISPGSLPSPELNESRAVSTPTLRRPTRGGLSRDRNATLGRTLNSQMVRLCAPCATFFETGVGETYSMLQKRETP